MTDSEAILKRSHHESLYAIAKAQGDLAAMEFHKREARRFNEVLRPLVRRKR